MQKSSKPDLTGRNTLIDAAKEIKILRRYQKTEGFTGVGADTAFSEALGVSRQVLSNWFNSINSPTNDFLSATALECVTTWQGDLAVELLNLRGLSVPCVCLEIIGDNGPCPKHGTLEVERA